MAEIPDIPMPKHPPPPVPKVTKLVDGTLVAPKGYRLIKTHGGTCLCDFAGSAESGRFRDCQPIRRVNTHLANKATLDDGDEVAMPDIQQKDTSSPSGSKVVAKRPNYPCAVVRFVGMNTSLNSRSAGLDRLGISNYRTDKTSANETGTEKPLFMMKGAPDASKMTDMELQTFADPDHFRVEVHDITAYKNKKPFVEVELQVLQPLYMREVTDGKTALRRDTKRRPDPDVPAGFKVPATASRKLVVRCMRVEDPYKGYYRSGYLRLVTFEKDRIADHTLFVGDYWADGANEDEKRYTEILHQKVRARYTPEMCTAKLCRAEAIADVGRLDGEIRLAVHIMDNCVTTAEVRRTVYKQIRRVYASAHVRPLIKHIYKHPPPKNLLLVGNPGGTSAPPSGISGLFARIDGAINPSTIELEVDNRKYTYHPSGTATVARVVDDLRAQMVADGFHIKELRDPYVPAQNTLEAARLLLVFRDAEFTDYAEVKKATCDDTRLSLMNAQITSAQLGDFPQDENDINHRVLKPLCETKWFDFIVLKKFHGGTLQGITTWLHEPYGPCVIVTAERVKLDEDDRCTVSHELGHALIHGGHFNDAARQEQLMLAGPKVNGDAFTMPGRRRLMDSPMNMRYRCNLDATGGGCQERDIGPGKPAGTVVSRIHSFVGGENFAAPSRDREPTADW